MDEYPSYICDVGYKFIQVLVKGGKAGAVCLYTEVETGLLWAIKFDSFR